MPKKTELFKFCIIFIILAMSFLCNGCRKNVQIASVQEGAFIRIAKTEHASTAPLNLILRPRTFGGYLVQVSHPKYDPMTFRLPYKFAPGNLIFDIFIFAPLCFFNLREPFGCVQVDLENRALYVKQRPNWNWRQVRYEPSERGEIYFERLDKRNVIRMERINAQAKK